MSHRSRTRGEGRSERGAVLVELAMVVPVLVLVAMGIIDFGTMLNDKIALKGGVREAVWNGGRQIFGSTVPCTLTGAAGSGDAAAIANTERLMCMAKSRAELPASEIRVRVAFVDIETPTAPGTYRAGAGLMVCAMRRTHSTTGVFSAVLDDTYQRAKLIGLIQSDAAPGLVARSEAPFTGQTWSFCDPTAAATT